MRRVERGVALSITLLSRKTSERGSRARSCGTEWNMVRGSRAGVGSLKRTTEQGVEGLTGVEVAVMTGAEGEVTNLRHTSPAHLGAAPVAGVDALASVSVVEDREAGVEDVEEP